MVTVSSSVPEKMKSKWSWPLTFWIQNVITSNWVIISVWILEFWVYNICVYKIYSNLDLWPLKSSQFILESKWMFVPNLMKFPKGVPEIVFTRTGQTENLENINISVSVCGCGCWREGMKTFITRCSFFFFLNDNDITIFYPRTNGYKRKKKKQDKNDKWSLWSLNTYFMVR